MATLIRYPVSWSGGALVGPGVSHFYFADGHTGFTADVVTLFSAMVVRFPAGVTWSFPNTGDLINDVTGDLVGTWTDGVSDTESGSGSSGYAKGVGALIEWNTAGITNNRRITGRTFLAPLDGTAFQSDGTVNNTVVTEFQTAANAFLTACDGNLRIWTRPRSGTVGKSTPVTSATVPDRFTWLRSRRT